MLNRRVNPGTKVSASAKYTSPGPPLDHFAVTAEALLAMVSTDYIGCCFDGWCSRTSGVRERREPYIRIIREFPGFQSQTRFRDRASRVAAYRDGWRLFADGCRGQGRLRPDHCRSVIIAIKAVGHADQHARISASGKGRRCSARLTCHTRRAGRRSLARDRRR